MIAPTTPVADRSVGAVSDRTVEAVSDRPALVVSDLDGTFLSPDGSVSAENAEAVLAAQAAGIPVLFATGRPVRWLDVIADLPGAHPTVIASNGAVLYDLGTKTVLDSVPLLPEVVQRVTRDIRTALPDCRFGLESGSSFGHEDGYLTDPDERRGDPAVHADTLEALVGAGPYVKLLVRHHGLGSDELAATVLAAVDERATVTYSGATSTVGLVEVSGIGVSKASMLARCCATLGVDARDVAAFGDMPNDIEMLGWVGHPHVMANAHPDLLRLGATVVGPNSESGVGRTIAGWLSQQESGRLAGGRAGPSS